MKCIIVGLGGRGLYWYRECMESPGTEVVACVKPTQKNMERVTGEYGVDPGIIFPSLQEAIDAVDADFIIDNTPPAAHEEIAMTAFESGLHILGEKPISDTFPAAKRIVEAGKNHSLKHMITQNYRFNPLPRVTRALLGADRIGRVGQLDVSLYVDWADIPGSHYVREPYMFLTDMGVHHFDMIRYTLGREPESVRAITWNLPWGWHHGDACQLILFRFRDGTVATHRGIGCTVGHVPAGHNGEWRYEGPKGTLTWEGFDLYYTHRHKVDPQIREKIDLDAEMQRIGDRSTAEEQNPMLREFIASVREDREPECSGEDNLNSLAMTFGAVTSAKENGREVFLSEL